jgi:hypothetical protein
MRRGIYIVIGLVIGIVSATAVPALATWMVTAKGEVNIDLADLKALEVGTAKTTEAALPGRKAVLVARVQNPNEIPLTIISSSISGLRADADGCDVSGIIYFDRKIDVPPGEHEGVELGVIELPKSLANACQGASLSATITVKAAYGVE